MDNIDVGPERRAYLETKMERVWELNSQGSIPYVPYLRAPFYVWVGRWVVACMRCSGKPGISSLCSGILFVGCAV